MSAGAIEQSNGSAQRIDKRLNGSLVALEKLPLADARRVHQPG
jgi:hypothetical protein